MSRTVSSRPVALIAALVLIALGIVAGNWQSGRAHDKEALRARLEQLRSSPPLPLTGAPVEAAALDLREVKVRGHWQPESGIFLDNKIRQGVVGYEVLMPLRINDIEGIEASTTSVLVNRGWIAAARDRAQLPQIRTSAGTVEVIGQARIPSKKFFELAPHNTADRRWQNVTIERFRDWSGLALLPVLILQTSPADDALTRQWDEPDLGIDKHRGYAFQWYALSAITLGLLIFFSQRHCIKK